MRIEPRHFGTGWDVTVETFSRPIGIESTSRIPTLAILGTSTYLPTGPSLLHSQLHPGLPNWCSCPVVARPPYNNQREVFNGHGVSSLPCSDLPAVPRALGDLAAACHSHLILGSFSFTSPLLHTLAQHVADAGPLQVLCAQTFPEFIPCLNQTPFQKTAAGPPV